MKAAGNYVAQTWMFGATASLILCTFMVLRNVHDFRFLAVVAFILLLSATGQAPWLVGGPSSLLMIGSDGSRSSDELRAALKRTAELGQEDYDRMSACARATAVAYSEDRIMKLQLALYEELLSE